MDQATVATIVTALVGLATTFITVILAPIALAQFKIQSGKLNEQARNVLLPAIQYAISYAKSQITKDPADASPEQLAISLAQAKAIALNYLKPKVKDALARLGVDDDALLEMIEARFQADADWMTVPASK